MQEMDAALKSVLKHPDGVALATSSRMKPIYAALMQMADLTTDHPGGAAAAAANTPRDSELTKAKSVVDLLIEHSDMPANASYDDLIMQAQASYKILETTAGSDCDDAFECLLSPNQLSTASPGAFDPGSRASSRGSHRRLAFTPTANLECSPAQCSPISRFHPDAYESSTPSVGWQPGSTPGASALAREGSSPMLSTAQTSPAADTPSAAGTPHHVARIASPLAREAPLPPLPSTAPGHAHLRVRTRTSRASEDAWPGAHGGGGAEQPGCARAGRGAPTPTVRGSGGRHALPPPR